MAEPDSKHPSPKKGDVVLYSEYKSKKTTLGIITHIYEGGKYFGVKWLDDVETSSESFGPQIVKICSSNSPIYKLIV